MSRAARISATQRAPEASNLLLPRKCACGGKASALTDQCEECATRRILGLQTKLSVSEPGDRYEQEADRVAEEVMRMPKPGMGGVPFSTYAQSISHAPPTLMRLSPERFQRRLGRTPEHRTVIDALFGHPTFRKLWDWIGKCEGERADHGPIKLRVGRTFSDGVQTFGEFNQTRGILTINPMFREAGVRVARKNPQELADTVVHELIHAASWALRTGKCPGQREPLPQTENLVDEKDRRLIEPEQEGLKPTERLSLGEELDRFERLGPSASDPCNYFLDIEAGPQAEIVEITDDIRQETGIGGPTRTRVNQILRNELRSARRAATPEATLAAAPLLRAFMRCRDEECAKRRRNRKLARCFDDVLSADELAPVVQRADKGSAIRHAKTRETAGNGMPQTMQRQISRYAAVTVKEEP